MSNDLKNENSPYLLQHAENPVHWKAWNDHTLQLARETNKPLLISVGYAACHWCHVMEKESFEDPEVAAIMNRYFINIKVDREERPDIDQLYMSAVQIMSGNGGWPMNVVALPDGRPFWGGTYFRKEQWIAILKQLGELYKTELPKIEEYAGKLADGIAILNRVAPPAETDLLSGEILKDAIAKWIPYMDMAYGGRKGAPKFMMPVNLNFLLKYGDMIPDQNINDYLRTTLLKMACGGIRDHLGGGFARYSTDEKWHIPHFEMMLYDNAQLLTTYALAYRKFKDPLYREVMDDTYQFMNRELQGERGEYFSSLDADSLNAQGKNEEGAYYTWTGQELQNTLGEDFSIFGRVYNINARGYWEGGRYVLYREDDPESLAEAFKITPKRFRSVLDSCKSKLLERRNQRPRPALDDKCITSWNALAVTGLTHAYLATGEERYIKTALENMTFIEKVMTDSHGKILHTYRKGKTGTVSFLEDYAFVIEACIALFQAGCGEHYILTARNLCNYTLDNFFDDRNQMFSFAPREASGLISNPVEKSDNVIPASNSVMAKNLFTLGVIFGNRAYAGIAEEMLKRMKEDLTAYPYSHANWLDLAMQYNFPFREVVITGPGAVQQALQLQESFLPNTLVIPSEKSSEISILKDRLLPGTLQFFVCKNQQCDLPVHSLEECLNLLTSGTK